MPVDDRTRVNLHRILDAVLGAEEADTLMAHLPPVTWDQVATKSDLDTQTDLLRAEMNKLGADLRVELTEGLNRRDTWMVTFAAARTTVLLTAARLLP